MLSTEKMENYVHKGKGCHRPIKKQSQICLKTWKVKYLTWPQSFHYFFLKINKQYCLSFPSSLLSIMQIAPCPSHSVLRCRDQPWAPASAQTQPSAPGVPVQSPSPLSFGQGRKALERWQAMEHLICLYVNYSNTWPIKSLHVISSLGLATVSLQSFDWRAWPDLLPSSVPFYTGVHKPWPIFRLLLNEEDALKVLNHFWRFFSLGSPEHPVSRCLPASQYHFETWTPETTFHLQRSKHAI